MQDTKQIADYRSSLRERIIEIALKAFASNGIRAVKMDDIATKLGISKRTLYEVFENKEILLYEGVRKYHESRHREFLKFADSAPSVLDIIIYIYQQETKESRNISKKFYEDIAKYPRILTYHDSRKKQNHKLVLNFIERGVNEGLFRPDLNYELTAKLFEAIGEYIQSRRLYSTHSFNDLFNNLFFTSLRGLCTIKGVMKLDELSQKWAKQNEEVV